jgi:hypothetical protein
VDADLISKQFITGKAHGMRHGEVEISDVDLGRIHMDAKNVIFMIEGLDAAIRSLEVAIEAYNDFGAQEKIKEQPLWITTLRSLKYRREMFQATRLKIISCQARIKNTIDLVSCISTDIHLFDLSDYIYQRRFILVRYTTTG